jgi:NAD(P)-dependent dehydrogenase (short-subunit alcohol dehydrogenase family)
MFDLSFDGQAAIVTGASKGIGRAIALALGQAGASVALAARGKDDLHRAAKEVEAAGGRALPVVTDVADLEAVHNLVDRTVEAFGSVDILVNNAGAAPFMSTIDQIRESGFEKYFRINFMGALYCTKAAGSVMLANQRGCVVNMASVAGFIASPGLSYYSTAKAAMINLTKTVAREWASSGIRVNAVAPGWVETEMNSQAREYPEFYQGALASIPLGRWAKPEDIVGPVLFLCSPAASFITGAILVVDGGQTTTGLIQL